MFSRLILQVGLLLLPGAVWSATGAPFTAILDPGHGGTDHGAVEGHLKESVITLAISQRTAALLERDRRFSAKLTRQNDEFLSLSQRVNRAQSLGGDVFISVHVNWSKESRAKGAEFYFQNQLPPDEESMFLAARENQEEHGRALDQIALGRIAKDLSPEVQLIVQDLARNHRIYASSLLAKSLLREWRGQRRAKSRSIHQAPFFVISNMPIPSALIEVGYLSNPEEARLLGTEAYQDTIAQSLYRGIIAFYESMDKRPEPRLK